jgi:hypothetical protein
VNIKNSNYLKVSIILFSISIFFLNFYFKEFLLGGSRGDFIAFVFNNIQSVKSNFIFSIKNYGLLKDANWPLFYIIHAFVNPFSDNVDTYLLSTTLIGFLTFIILSFTIKNNNFSYIQSLALASMILLMPWFNGRAHWGTSANLGWFFLVITFYFYSKIKLSSVEKNSKNLTLFFICFFSSIALYIRPAFAFFPVFFIITYFLSAEKFRYKFSIIAYYLLLSIPGWYLIYLWGGIYDHKNSDVVSDFHNYKNIINNIPLILNFFFFYLWPAYIFYIFDRGFKFFFKDHYISFFLLIFIFTFLSIKGDLHYLSNFTLGGGAILEFGYLIHDKYNIIFLLCSALGGSFIFNIIKNNYKNNFLLIIIILVVFGYPKFLYQDYLEPLVYLLLFCGLFKTDLLELVKKNFNKVIIIYSIYLTLYNLAAITYFNYNLT